MISDEAVEAAAKAFIEYGTLLPALEASAPYMLAGAWDEGRKHGATYPYGERGLATDDNPYRSQP